MTMVGNDVDDGDHRGRDGHVMVTIRMVMAVCGHDDP